MEKTGFKHQNSKQIYTDDHSYINTSCTHTHTHKYLHAYLLSLGLQRLHGVGHSFQLLLQLRALAVGESDRKYETKITRHRLR